MRRAIVLVVTMAVLAGAGWRWRSHAVPTESLSHPEADEQARARLERLRAQLVAASSAPLPSPRGELEIGGRVISRGGPVAGARVTATTPDPDVALSTAPCGADPSSSRRLLELSCDVVGQLASAVAERRGDAQPMARATTDATGRFTLQGLEAGTYALWAEAPEGAGVNKRVAAGSDGDVLLGEGMRIRGKVVDRQGQPVEAAVVTAIFPDPSRFFDTLSAADGSFSLGPLPSASYVVIAQSGALVPDRAEQLEESREWLRLTLHPARRLRGRILQDGSPAPGVSVTLLHGWRDETATTDQAGAFDFRQVRAGDVFLTARRGNFQADAQVLIPERVDPPGVVLHLEVGGRVECSVRSTTGAPVSQAKVSMFSKDRGPWEVPVTVDGSCRIEGLRPDRYSLNVQATGFRELESPLLNVYPGETAMVWLLLEPVPSLKGTVLDPEGRPLAGATVRTLRPDLGPERTGDDGRFSIDGPPEESVTLEVSHERYATTILDVALPAPRLAVRLVPGSDVDGEVLDAAGSPVEGAWVQACEGRLEARALESGECDTLRDVETDAAGAFHLHALPRGPLSLIAAWPRTGLTGQKVLKVLERTTSDRVTLRFPPAGRIAGVAVDEVGRPLQYVWVMAYAGQGGGDQPPTRVGMLVSDEAGAFEFPALEVGGYRLNGQLDGYHAANVRARTGDEDVQLVLHPGARVRGRVVTASGEPVTVFRLNGKAFDEPSGRFAIVRQEGSQMAITVEAGAGLAAVTRHIPPGAGDHALGDIVVSAGRRVAGRVLDAETGLGIPGALVAAGRDPGRQDLGLDLQRNAVAARPDGSFELSHVDEEAEALVAWRDGYERAVLRMAGETEVRVRLVRMGRIAGDVQWKGQQGLSIYAQGVDTPSHGFGRTDPFGHFVIDDLPAGQYSLHVLSFPEHAVFFPVTVRVPPSQEVRVTILANDDSQR